VTRADLSKCDGVGRLQLEARVERIARALTAIEARLQARADNAGRLATHPDPVVQQSGVVRENAYRTALADVQTLLEDALGHEGDGAALPHPPSDVP
jgi:hypothetical protein